MSTAKMRGNPSRPIAHDVMLAAKMGGANHSSHTHAGVRTTRLGRFARFVLAGRRRAAPGPMRRPKLLVFDFDGTIADTFEAGFGILNQLAAEFGFRSLPRSELEHARDMRTRELMRFLHIPMRKMSRIARRGSEELSARIHEIQPLAGVPEAVRALKERGYALGIVTSNTGPNVATFLRNHDLELFDFVRSSSKLMGKAREIRAVLRSLGLAPEDLLFVGDETRDIEAAHKAGLRIAAVTWGYNSRRSLEGLNPDFVFHEPAELVGFLDRLPEAEPGGTIPEQA